MNKEKKSETESKIDRKKNTLFLIGQFASFFLLMAFVITCNFLLFLHFIPMEVSRIKIAARVTFVNIIFLTLVFCVIDSLRRYITVVRPVRKIQEALNQIVKGNFNVRVPYVNGENSFNQFDRIARSINLMIDELKSVETLRTDFVSNVSHELKTPLAVMQNYGTLLQAPHLGEEKRIEYALAVTAQTQKLSELITNILKLNRLENQKIFAKKESFDLGEAVCGAMLNFEQAWEKKNLEIETDIEEELTVCTDKNLLDVVVNNLVSNAIKFTPENGKIKVTVRQDGHRALVQVRDNGCGMDSETGRHIFEKFYQGDTSHAVQGNGLGLALVKKIVDI